ncbi:MAG: hypothetical protein Q7I94_03425 [Candidatus Contubernalis sp.]|nr:hypothetical protein [Candidatus Contubernalis sp.]
MKYIIIFCLVLVMVIFPACQSEPEPQPDLPGYTADQVIYVAQAQYPIAYRYSSDGLLQTPTSVTVTYLERGIWKVEISCPPGYSINNSRSGVSSDTLYFYEADGSLHTLSYYIGH